MMGELCAWVFDSHRKPRAGRLRSPFKRRLELVMQRPVAIAGWMRATISPGLTKRRPDADNRIKVLLDLLVEHRLIEDTERSPRSAWRGQPTCRPAVCVSR